MEKFKQYSNWENFTNLYQLQKTLRFELKPTEATQRALDATEVVHIDKSRHEAFKEVKKVLDIVHRQFITDSLDGLELDTDELQTYLNAAFNKDAKPDEVKKARKPIFDRFTTCFAVTDKEWQARHGFSKPFISSPEIQLLAAGSFIEDIADKLQLTARQIKELLSRFEKFATYFQGYKDNRYNCYTSEGKATEVASRAIVQNLAKYYKNLEKYHKFYTAKDSLAELSQGADYYFKLGNYKRCLTQKEITAYNTAIGRFNSFINEARQQQGKGAKPKLPMFEPLFKQILGDSEKAVYFEVLQDKKEYDNLVKHLQSHLPNWLKELKTHFGTQVKKLVNPHQTYLSKRAVNTILSKTLEDTDLVRSFLPKKFAIRMRSRDDGTTAQNNFISVQQFFAALDHAQAVADVSILKDLHEKVANPSEFVWRFFCRDLQTALQVAEKSVQEFSQLIVEPNQETVKKAFDDFNDVYRMYSYFELRYRNEPVTTLDGDSDFYALFADDENTNSLFDTDKDERFPHYYDLVRNWLTKKPYSLNKWKLNFDCPNLLGGWDVNKEPDKHGVLLGNNGDYYLAVLSNENSRVFEKSKNPELFNANDNKWQKMEYKLLPGANKMLPKCLLPKKDRSKYGATDEIVELYEKGEFKKGATFSITKLHKLIDFYKQGIALYEGWRMYEFNFRETASYDSIDQFYHDVEEGGYKLEFVPVNGQKINELEQNRQIYLFKIVNKDLVRESSNSPNAHTLYFRQLFEPNSSIKLNGEAEVFFRPKSIDSKVDEKRQTPQGDKIIEHKRFTEDKIFFHIPATFNYRVKSVNNFSYNRFALRHIGKGGINAIIGLDRGEKHLVYIAMVDKNGKLLEEPISLNEVNGIPYFDLLTECEKERKENRQNWQAVRKIKDLKDGYIGHCVKRVVDLMVKHNSVVVLEKLNVGFKQGRSAIERSVYNQFEQALLKKLQYLVDKSAAPQTLFGAQKGVQLTPSDVSPKMTGNHMGFVFFVDPSYTSAIDPVSGYRQYFRLDERINTLNFQQFILGGYDEIEYTNGNLVFKFSWRRLAEARNRIGKDNLYKEVSKISAKPWRVTANVSRSVYKKNKNNQGGVTEQINPQERLLELFAKNNISLKGDLRQTLTSTKTSTEFVKTFLWCFNLINKLRNTISQQDAIISPVYPNGFNSLTDKLDGYLWNGDANGAYNIARKGSMLIQRIEKNLKDPDLFIRNKDWDEYAQKNNTVSYQLAQGVKEREEHVNAN